MGVLRTVTLVALLQIQSRQFLITFLLWRMMTYLGDSYSGRGQNYVQGCRLQYLRGMKKD